MRLLDFALRQLEKGHEPWSRRKKALAVVLTAALVLGTMASAYMFAVQGFPID